MARKSSARRPKRAVKSGKSKSPKAKGTRVPTKRKAVKKARPKARVAKKATPSRATKSAPKSKPAPNVAARLKVAKPAATAPAKTPIKAVKSPTKGSGMAQRGSQSAFEFDSEPAISTFSEKVPK